VIVMIHDYSNFVSKYLARVVLAQPDICASQVGELRRPDLTPSSDASRCFARPWLLERFSDDKQNTSGGKP
jgi:hypothetical protein